jgi:hypothetical protein
MTTGTPEGPPTLATITVPTIDDVHRNGYDAVLARLRELADAAHAKYPQYRDWNDDTELAWITQRQGGGRTFVRAELGDVVLAKPAGDHGRSHGHVTAFAPRVGWVCVFSWGFRRLRDA